MQDAVRGGRSARAWRTCPSAWTAAAYQWADLHGEGIPGILTEQAGAWFYKRNLSPITVKLPTARARSRRSSRPLETRRPQAQRSP